MTDQNPPRSPLSQRLRQEELAKRNSQHMQRVADNKARASGSIPTPQSRKSGSLPTPSVDAITQGTQAGEIVRTTTGIDQIRRLVAAGYKDEARQAIKRYLYKDSMNAEAWWLYAQVAEDEDQLYHILSAFVKLPTNQFTAQARARLSKMSYREPLKGSLIPSQPAEWLTKTITQQIAAVGDVVSDVARETMQGQEYRRVNRKPIIALIAVILIGTILLSALSAISQSASATAPTATAQIPMVTAGDLLNYLLKVKQPISNANSLDVPNAEWKSDQGIRFDVVQGDEKGTFIVLSYSSYGDQAGDLVRASLSPRYKTWKASQSSNLLILISPETPASIVSTLGSHIAQYLIAPYRSYVSTATATVAK